MNCPFLFSGGACFPAGRQGIPLRKNKLLEFLGGWLVVQQNLKSRTHPLLVLATTATRGGQPSTFNLMFECSGWCR